MFAKKLTIGMPVYNCGDSVESSIVSILNQTFEVDFELLIVNDGSTDNSIETLLKYSEKHDAIRVIDLAENKGVVNARNLILKEALGEYIAWIDADDEWTEDRLAHQLPKLFKAEQENPDDKLCITGDYLKNSKLYTVEPYIYENVFANLLNGKLPGYLCIVICRTDYLRSLGDFDERMTRGEDQDMIIRFLLAGGRFVYSGPDPIYIYHFNRGNVSAEKSEDSLHVLMEKYPDLYSAMESKDYYLARRYTQISELYLLENNVRASLAARIKAFVASPQTHSFRFIKYLFIWMQEQFKLTKSNISDAKADIKKLNRKIKKTNNELKELQTVSQKQQKEIETLKRTLQKFADDAQSDR